MIENLDPFLCTHFVYNSADIDITGLTIIAKNEKLDLDTDGGKGFYNKFTSMKNKNPLLKTLLSLTVDYIFQRTPNMKSTKLFTHSIPKFLDQHNFDGLHLVWVSFLDKKLITFM